VPPSPSTTGEPIAALEQVSMRFGRQMVLRDLDLRVCRGETVAVIGESGCGKTVLLKLIAGLILPTSGSVRFEGASFAVLRAGEVSAARRKIGFLFQSAALFDSLNVFDNVAFGLRAARQMNELAIRQCVRERLRDVGLPASAEARMPSELSGGMKKRVGLARALALNPDLMLYDEPTTGLDPIMSDVINELIVRTRRTRPITSVVVTHDMKTARKVADRIVMLYPLARLGAADTQILFDGNVDDFLTCPDVRVREFIEGDAGGRPAIG